jgi:hypothetical protein
LTAVLVGLGIAFAVVKVGSVKAGLAMLKSGLMAAKGWVIALAPILAVAGALAGLILIIEDIFIWLTDPDADTMMGRLFGSAEDNAFIQGIYKVFHVIFAAVEVIIDKVKWIIDQAISAYQWITGHKAEDEIVKDELKKQGMSEKDAEGQVLMKRLGWGDTKEYDKAYQKTMVPQIDFSGATQPAAGPVTQTANITNTINISGGDTEKVRKVVGEELAKSNRQFENTVGGGKKK